MKVVTCYLTPLLLLVSLSASNCLAVERVYVGLGDLVMTFDMSGKLLNSFPVEVDEGDYFLDMAINHLGEIYVITQNDDLEIERAQRLDKYSPKGNLIDEIVSRDELANDGSYLFSPTIGPDGNLYLSSSKEGGFNTIIRYSPNGDPLGVFATVRNRSRGPSFGVQFDSAQQMYVANRESIEKYDTSGKWLGTIRKDRNWWGLLLDLNIDDNDIIRTIAYFGTDNVYAFSTAGTLLSVWDPQLIHLNAIATDTNGLIYLGGNDKSNPNGPGVVKTFFGDGTPAGVFVTDLPFRQVMSLKIVDIVPEPRTEIMAASFYMLVAYCFTRRKQPCAPRHACNTASSDSCVLKKGRPRRL